MQINLNDYADWVGKILKAEDTLSISPLNRMSATLESQSREFSTGDEIPHLWHWLYFLESTPRPMLAQDGHAKKGGFLPPITLPRRMWAGSRFSFKKNLKAGERVFRTSCIKDIAVKQGKSGTLVFVKVLHEINNNTGLALSEEHDIVYREKPTSTAIPPTTKQSEVKPDFSETFTPDPVILFRYSALTFNGHRIHYDREYVTNTEGYPGLLVHGPLLATLLIDNFQRHQPDLKITDFEFKALHPVFDLNPLKICSTNPDSDNKAVLWIEDHQQNLCMRASVSIEREK